MLPWYLNSFSVNSLSTVAMVTVHEKDMLMRDRIGSVGTVSIATSDGCRV